MAGTLRAALADGTSLPRLVDDVIEQALAAAAGWWHRPG
jgi:hypothetical protein